MKIIEALKKTKDLARKADDLKHKIALYHADMDHESPTYGTAEDQRKQISEWLQGYSDILKEILSLRVRIQKTNLVTQVPITLGDKLVTKSIAEWIHRRKDLATLDRVVYEVLNDKGLPSQANIKTTTGEQKEIRIRRYYDPKVRDTKLEEYRSEPRTIDGSLEVVNALTDLLE